MTETPFNTLKHLAE